jgi:hypothetical protein
METHLLHPCRKDTLLLGGWTNIGMSDRYVHLNAQDVLEATEKAAEAVRGKKKESE